MGNRKGSDSGKATAAGHERRVLAPLASFGGIGFVFCFLVAVALSQHRYGEYGQRDGVMGPNKLMVSTFGSERRDVHGDSNAAVRLSGIQGGGKGAFALRNFEAGQQVGFYRCNIIAKQPNASASLVWVVNSTHGCDAGPFPHRNPMRYVNSVSTLWSCGRQNVEMRLIAHKHGESPIAYVATTKIANGDELFVDYGEAYFKKRPKLLTAGARYECGLPPLHLASARGDMKTLRAVLDKVPSVEALDYKPPTTLGWTPLLEAAAHGQAEVAKLLLAHGANVNKAAEWGDTPLHIAILGGHSEVVALLVRGGANVDQRTTMHTNALLLALQQGDVDVLRAVLEGAARKHVDLEMADYNGATALYIASHQGRADMVRVLLEKGADVDNAMRHYKGATALFAASQAGHAQVSRVLIRAGATVDKPTDQGEVPLSIASQFGHAEVVKALLDGNVEVDRRIPKYRNLNALHIACQQGHVDVVRFLLQGHADINQIANYGTGSMSAMSIARQKGHTQVVQVLLDSAA